VTSRLAIASLNIHGVPLSRPPATVRAARIGELAGRMDLDVLCVQEVHSYPVLRALAAALPSLPYPGHVPGAARPSGGLVTFTRDPAARTTFRPLPAPGPGGQPDRLRRLLNAERRKGLLVTDLAGGAGTVINLQLSPNREGDWSPGNRYAAVHRAQLAAVTAQATAEGERHTGPLVITGDFNVAKDSDLFTGFAARSGLEDAFARRYWQPPRPGRPRTDHPRTAPAGPSGRRKRPRLSHRGAVRPGQPPAYLSDHLASTGRESRPALTGPPGRRTLLRDPAIEPPPGAPWSAGGWTSAASWPGCGAAILTAPTRLLLLWEYAGMRSWTRCSATSTRWR
jgi:exonuclease III